MDQQVGSGWQKAQTFQSWISKWGVAGKRLSVNWAGLKSEFLPKGSN